MPPGAEIDRAVERLLRRDRQVVISGLVLLTALSWLYLYYLTLQMDMGTTGMNSAGSSPLRISDMVELASWSTTEALLMFAMWSIMMVGMMIPSATPMVLLYARVVRHNSKDAEPLAHTGAFFAGYLIVWIAFSLIATTLQWSLEEAALLSPMMTSTSPILGGLVLLIAAIYQWTPYKEACLHRCRSPVSFLSEHWQEGAGGALKMGLAHGGYCLGCCWSLMLLLFVGGVMNLLCVAAITIFVLIEKVTPWGRAIGRAGAFVLGLFGLGLLMSV